MMVRNTGMPLCNISPTEKIILDLISFFILWAGTKLKVADHNIMPNARYLSPRKRSVGEALNNTKRAEMFFSSRIKARPSIPRKKTKTTAESDEINSRVGVYAPPNKNQKYPPLATTSAESISFCQSFINSYYRLFFLLCYRLRIPSRARQHLFYTAPRQFWRLISKVLPFYSLFPRYFHRPLFFCAPRFYFLSRSLRQLELYRRRHARIFRMYKSAHRPYFLFQPLLSSCDPPPYALRHPAASSQYRPWKDLSRLQSGRIVLYSSLYRVL